MLLGIVQLIGATLCVILVRITGKRPLVLVSLVMCGLCFASTAFYATKYSNPSSNVTKSIQNQSTGYNMNVSHPNEFIQLTNENVAEILNGNTHYGTHGPRAIGNEAKNDLNPFGWVPLILLLGAALFIHIGIGLVPWMLIGEMYPTNIRSGSSSISIGLGYLFAFFANKLYFSMVKLLTLAGLFWFNAAISAGGCVLIYFILPETEGRTLLEIENDFARKKSLPR